MSAILSFIRTECISLFHHKCNIFDWIIITYSYGVFCPWVYVGAATFQGHVIPISSKLAHIIHPITTHLANRMQMDNEHFAGFFFHFRFNLDARLYLRCGSNHFVDNGILSITSLSSDTGRWMWLYHRWRTWADTDELNPQIAGQFEFQFQYRRWHHNGPTLNQQTNYIVNHLPSQKYPSQKQNKKRCRFLVFYFFSSRSNYVCMCAWASVPREMFLVQIWYILRWIEITVYIYTIHINI